VPGHHVRAEGQLAALIGVSRSARKDLDLLRDALADNPPDHR
jgi:alkylated DNA nucleotide flippase Atl1